MRSHTLSLFACCSLLIMSLHAQKQPIQEFGVLLPTDQQLNSYPQDPDAAGVVLYERGRNYWKLIDGQKVRLIKEVHRKIKVLDADNFEHATVFIPYYKGSNASEIVSDFKAVTHNGDLQNFVGENAIFETEETPNWRLKRFTFPNVKDGSVLEYTYKIESPFDFNFNGWQFQSDLPKLYSEFTSEIPGNYQYHRSLIGNEKLAVNDVYKKENCFWLPGHKINADCEVATYAMVDVPAFKEEKYMLSKKNYMAKVEYELAEYTNYYGIRTKYTQDWDDADKEFRTNKELGKQLKLNYYFKDVIPEHIKNLPSNLDKAKATYSWIQSHYNWNGRSPFFGNVDVKKAFENGSGNVSEINFSLINALQALDLDTKMVVSSTRNNGLPRLNYPVITDFNYVLALLKVEDQEFLLDATDKYIPFGMLPFRTLNIQGRVMDYKEGSYWHPLKPELKNVHYVNVQATLDEKGILTGAVNEINTGYLGAERRRLRDSLTKATYITAREYMNPRLNIFDLVVEDKETLDKPLKEKYSFSLEIEEVGDSYLINPFDLNNYFDENPFKLEERNYPVDFGHPHANTFLISIDLDGKYEVSSLPENRLLKLTGEAGECSVIYNVSTDGKINLRYSLKLNEYIFSADSYRDLKKFFGSIAAIQTNEAILLKKI